MASRSEEKILNSFLREVVGSQQPPDLSARILSKLETSFPSAPTQPATNGSESKSAAPQPPPLPQEQERILNSFLHEMIGSQAPPNVEAEILAKHASEKTRLSGARQQPKFKVLDGDPPGVDVPLQPVESIKITPDKQRQTQLSDVPVVSPAKRSGQKTRSLAWISMSVAALVLVALTVGITLIVMKGGSNNGIASNDPNPDNSATNQDLVDNDNRSHQPVDPWADLIDPEENRTPDRIAKSGSSGDQNAPPVINNIPLLEPGEIVIPPEYRSVAFDQEPITPRQLTDLIDDSLTQVWAQENVQPVDNLADNAWLIRVANRILGQTPAADEIQDLRNLLDDEGRKSVVEHLMTHEQFRPRFIDNLANSMAMKLLGLHPNLPVEQDANLQDLKDYVKQSLVEKKPWDEIAYELLSAVGSVDREDDNFNPASSFITVVAKRHGEQRESWTNHISQVFLNQNTQCAQCHSTSDGQLAQSEFWKIHAYFTQTQFERNNDGNVMLVNRDYLPRGRNSLVHAGLEYEDSTGNKLTAFPEYFGSDENSKSGLVKQFDRRTAFALEVAQSEQWRETLVNHVWSLLLNSPLEPHNREGEPLWHDLQATLGTQLAANGFDVEPLVEAIVLSRPFALAVDEENAPVIDNPMLGTDALFTRFYEYPVRFRVSNDALAIVADAYSSAEQQDLIEMRGVLAQRVGGTRIQTPDTIKITEGLPDKEAGWGQNLENSVVLQKIVDSNMTDTQKVEHLIMAALKRAAKPGEVESCLVILEDSQNKQEAYQDIWWALFNSFEFTLPGGIR